tara:strand:- start:1719 stop:2018 length:300 start_codon:yes stop_codon:yes gene_type:complete
MSAIKPVNGHLVLRPTEDEETEKLHGNIILPNMEKQDIIPSEVISCSSHLNYNTGEMVPSPVKKGDIVLTHNMGGMKFTYENKEYLIVKSDQIMAILKK